MKFAQSIIVTLCLLAFGQSAFAQSPKDVVVVNSPAVTVSNLPTIQLVQVENGALHPVQVMDVSPKGVPFKGFVLDQHADCLGIIEFQQDIPAGMLLRLDGVSGLINGEPDKSAVVDLTAGNSEVSVPPVVLRVKVDTITRDYGGGIAINEHTIFQEFDNLPLIRTALDGGQLVVVFNRCANNAGISGNRSFRVYVWGRLFDDPAL